jgi:hypothetical protein
MRWEQLFDDLEARAAALEQAERSAEVDDRTRGEVATLGLVDRLRAAVDTAVRVRGAGFGALSGTVVRVGPDWLLIDEGGGREALIALAGVLSVEGAGRLSAVPGSAGAVAARLRMPTLLRGIVRDRSAVHLLLSDGTATAGTLDRVGRDFVELAAHPAGEPRRRQEVREVQLVPLTAVMAIRRSV